MALFDRLRDEPVYNTRAVVQRTGVPADTVRAWERRYGLPVPTRTAGNQRLYSERDIAIINWLRDQTRAGLTISQAVALFRSEDAAGVRRGPIAADPSGAGGRGSLNGGRNGQGRYPSWSDGGRSLRRYRDEVVEALTSFDAAAADRVVEEAMALLPVEEVCLAVLQEALIEIGERWQRGEVSVGAEHFASGFVVRKLSALFNLSRPDRGRGPILAACVEGELHEIGLLLTCLFLSRQGFRIVYLGANLPTDDLLATIRRVGPPVILLSATTEPAARRLRETVAAVRASLAKDASGWYAPTIGFGGSVFVHQPSLREGIGGIFLGRNAEEVVVTVDHLLAQPSNEGGSANRHAEWSRPGGA